MGPENTYPKGMSQSTDTALQSLIYDLIERRRGAAVAAITPW
ncbi:hypothetical protein GCM10011588_63150 [Nocardia jinanensis]|uniref:Uncharacterized protein n=1 Tax=Nocardia jinanensis TaxID=382504 RepID=A0A917VYQ4_9NOCA|nr:hypothetical protein GCM10011588_63150 [Nocardia jinanensis]